MVELFRFVDAEKSFVIVFGVVFELLVVIEIGEVLLLTERLKEERARSEDEGRTDRVQDTRFVIILRDRRKKAGVSGEQEDRGKQKNRGEHLKEKRQSIEEIQQNITEERRVDEDRLFQR